MPASFNSRTTLVLAAGLAFAATASAQQANYVTSYIVQPNGNQTAINDGGTIPFPSTNLNTTSSASFVIFNSGTGAGSVSAISASGGGFTVSGLPLLPATLAPGAEIRFTISFTPTTRGAAAGTLSVGLGSGRETIKLAGQAIGAALTYTSTASGSATPLTPGGTLTLPSTALGATVSADIRVTNGGDANANIGTVNVVGTGYRLTNVPPLPATLTPGGSLVFTLIFNPTTAGAANGTLVIDSATFTLAAVGTGASLVYSSLVGSTSTVVQNAGTVVFPNTNVGATSTVSILVNNTGNSAATVSGIAVSGDGFSLPNLPKLPATINPGATLQFNVAFTAGSTASVTGVLQIDSVGINLRGNGNPPPSLSAVSFSNLPANASPRQQPVVSLAIAQPYPLDVTGKLTLTFASDSFADDPAIQFASGGRTVNFTIPAGTTDAVFSAANQVQLQTGTVAGVITLTANFSLASVDLTPNPAPSAKMVVTAGPPQLTAVQVGARTTNSFELLITGLSTPRQVSQIGLQFTPTQGSTLQTNSLVVNTDASFSSWYQSQAGLSFGSQFTASVIVNVTGNVNSVQSVAVTASNSRGDSNSVSVSLR
jgi:hypothetical protein